MQGREACGIVQPGAEADALKNELIARLSACAMRRKTTLPSGRLYATSQLYKGPYLGAAPESDHRIQRRLPNIMGRARSAR